MKKVFIFLAIILLVLFYLNNREIEHKKEVVSKNEIEEKGVFISYIDYAILQGKGKKEMESIIADMITNVKDFGLNSIILQTNPFSDAIYPSRIYQSSHVVVQKEGDKLPLDILDFFIKKAKENGISVYAWVNPYRIRNKNDIDSISKDSYYYKWLDTNNIERSSNGIFFNPASNEVLEYIMKVLKELCTNYDIKGVIYDDYYYPSETIDLENYEKTGKRFSIKQYRINNINKLIEESYKTIKGVDKSIKFGLSPSGNIENNLNKEYLDVESVLKENYIDMIIPQLYYGFYNSSKPYIKTLNQWSNLNRNNHYMYVALSLYKSGKQDKWAGKGINEWIQNNDIIKRQILVSRNISNYKGFYIFRYDYLFRNINNKILNEEIDNLNSIVSS